MLNDDLDDKVEEMGGDNKGTRCLATARSSVTACAGTPLIFSPASSGATDKIAAQYNYYGALEQILHWSQAA